MPSFDFVFCLLSVFLSACAVVPTRRAAPPAPLAGMSFARLPPGKVPAFEDDADTASLRAAALHSLEYYRGQSPDGVYSLAGDRYTVRDLADSITYFVDLLDRAASREAWISGVRRDFQTYQALGADELRTVTFSAYYEPTIQARLHRTPVYRYPIYGRPADLIDVDLETFNPAYQGARISGRREGRRLAPYYTRADIDSRHALRRRGRIVAWARSPVDLFFLQVEGTGWLNLGRRKRLRIRYDGDNGRPYRSVGQYVAASGRIPGNTLTHEGLQQYLNDHPRERQALLNVDERYVFFRVDRSTSSPYAYGGLEVPLTPGRSIAADPKIFPKGMLAWIDTEQPGQVPLKRFVFGQDEGGAIQGSAHVDYFVGAGSAAEQFATHFWQPGKLYVLVKKKEIKGDDDRPSR